MTSRIKVRRKSSITYDGEVPMMSRDDAGRLPAVARFVEGLKSVEVERRDSAYFECKIKGNPFPDITWFKDGFQLDIPTENKWTETCRDGKHTLVVRSVCLEDEGSYRCTAINKLGRDSSMALLRIAQYSDEAAVSESNEYLDVRNGNQHQAPDFILAPQSVSTTSGEVVNFACQVVGDQPLFVEWYKDSVNLTTTGKRFITSAGDKSYIEIRDSSFEDAGSYKCVASNKAGKSTCYFELTITSDDCPTPMSRDDKPHFTHGLQSQRIKVGDRVRLECKVEGKPKPSINWYKDGRLLKSSSRSKITEVCGNHSLVIFRAESADRGAYSLTATNHFGSKSSTCELEVEGVGPIRSPSQSSLSTIDKAFASRRVTGSASPFGASLKSPMRGGGGQQRKRGPGFILRPRPQNINSGEKLVLKCTLLGHPKPTVTWNKGGELVDEDRTGGRVITRNDGNDYFLEIEETNSSDAGKYTVTARNSLGKQTASVEVVIAGSDGSVTTASKSSSTAQSTPSTNGTVLRHNDTANHKQQSSLESSTASDDDRKPQKPIEHSISSNFKSDNNRDSSTSSQTSTLSSQSRYSSSSNTSRHDAEAGERPSTRLGRRKPNIVAPAFIRRLSSTQVLEGEELLLQCEVTGDPEPRMVWRRNGTEVGIDEDEVFTSYREGIARLRLRDVQSLHAGEYVCMARNDAGSVQCSSRVTVKAKRMEMRPKFKKSPPDVRAVEGETLTLEAEVEGMPIPEVVWSLDGEEISNGDATYNSNVAKLILYNVTPAASGQYMCNALNSSGEDSVACRVRVKAKKVENPPEFTSPLSDVTVEEGDDLHLRCVVAGTPQISIQWLCDDDILEEGDGIKAKFRDGVASLTLEQTVDEDSGVYSCMATNTAGTSSSQCNVTVTKKAKPEKKSSPASPPKFLNTFDEYIRMQEGETLKLQCDVSGNPAPNVTWSMDDREVENSTTSYEDGHAEIVISPITSDHAKNPLKCEISNTAGKKSHQAKIYVRTKRVAPVFESKLPDSVSIHEGEETCFECRVTGHPQPRVSWTRDGRSLSVLSSETSYENGVASVRIRKAGPREAGKYVCVARNLSGEAESVCTVRYVEGGSKPRGKAPAFTTTIDDVTLQDGQDLHLECKVTGDPVPAVTWELDGQTIEPEEGDIRYQDGVASLVLEDAMPEDSGEYTCIASNSTGKAKCSCRVTVQEAKKIEPIKPLNIKADPSFPIVLDDVTIKEGEDILLTCQATGNPRPTIKWLVDGDEITDAEIKYDDDGVIELLLKEAVPDDDGVYTCIAESPLKRVMTSCKVSIDALPRVSKKKNSAAKKQSDPHKLIKTNSASPQVESEPSFIQPLEDVVVQDGSIDFELSCRVSGNPTVKWFHDEEELEESEDFHFVSDGDLRKLVFAEVFPDDSGAYTCLISNKSGEARSSCSLNVQEIDGEPPIFVLKPKPVTVSIGGRAAFTCRVDGDPPPTVQWLFCNRPVENDRARITGASPDNNYTHTLEIPQVSSQDAGRYSVCCRNLLGDITCTVSLIVDDVKRQESRKDFRDVLKKSSPVKTSSNKQSSEDNMDFRSVLKKPSERDPLGRTSSNEDEESKGTGVAYKEVLSKSVKTKALSEEQRKLLRAEQKDFRDNLVRKVDTKVVSQDALRHMASDQLDFRDEALKTKVQTKSLEQDLLKLKSAEQKDFRAETLKSKVVTKAYKEEDIKSKKAEQVDFRKVLSSTKSNESEKPELDEGVKIADVPRAKWKKEVDHTTVSTKRARRPVAGIPDKKAQRNEVARDEESLSEEEEPEFSKPEFIEGLQDVSINDSEPFELTCKVVGNPRPEVKWFLDDEEVAPEDDVITVTFEDDVCRLAVAESFPEDQGRYTCKASNDHGETSCSCYVTVVGDESTKVPAKVLSGPKDCVISKGDQLCLSCFFEGTPPIKAVWRKGRNEIISSSSCRISSSEKTSKLTISSCEGDSSGCYTLQLSNEIGVDQFSVSVQVVDVPDSPGTPFTDVRRGKGIIVSWYGCAYDGGSQVTQYSLEMIKIADYRGKNRNRWIDVASTNGTSHTVGNLEDNMEYKFRVSAKNKHGWSKPGSPSDSVRYLATVENGNESTDEEDEEDFVKYEDVSIKKNEKFSSKYEIREKLGQGRFGKVHRVIHRKTGKEFAAKIMRALKAKDRQAVALEIEIMNQLRHPKLVQLIEAYQQEREVSMVMDLVAGGELFERVIDDDFVLTEAACIKYMRQICHGVKFMHNNHIIHLDLKPENIMCVDKTGTRVKLIDFGLARKFNPSEPIRVMFGTPEFVAPEVINYDTIGFQTDMWSVGVICYILLSGLSPFSGDADSETLSNVTAATWDFEDEAFDQISDDAKDFISQLLVKNLRHRYTVDQAINHTWLKKNTNKMKKSKLDTRNLRRFLTKRKWQKTGNAVRALGRLATLAKLSAPKVSRSGIVERESGFLTSLRAQLEREKEAEKSLPDKQKLEFVEAFSNVEVIEGTAACFSCVIAGIPDPQVTWYFEERMIKSTRRIRTSNTEDGATLVIKDAYKRDEGQYTCKAVNPEGEISHSALLTVVKM